MYFSFVDDFMLAHNRPGKGDANRVLFLHFFAKELLGILGISSNSGEPRISFWGYKF